MEQTADTLVGRKQEIAHLASIVESKEAEFVVVYGRRRVGKYYIKVVEALSTKNKA